MPPKNPDLETQVIAILQSESTEAAGELKSSSSSQTIKDRMESKKKDELGHEFHERRIDSSSLPNMETGTSSATAPTKREGTVEENSSGRERLKRHRVEVAGRVWIPDLWGQEDFLTDWIDCTVFDAALRNSRIMSARVSLMEEGRRTNSARFRIENRC